MVSYQIEARRIDDRPDKDGYTSSGLDLPTFTIPDTLAADATHAAAVAHDIAGRGVKNLTRTTVRVYWVHEDGRDEWQDSTQYWFDGRMVEPTRVMRQYARGGNVVGGGLYDEQDADEVTWFTHDGGVWLTVEKSPRGKWAVRSSDFVQFLVSDYKRRFASPDEALQHAQQRYGQRERGTVLVEISDWLSEEA